MNGKSSNERIIFGLKLRQWRQKRGLSFSELSERCGLSVSYLNEIEKGKKFPKPEKLKSLARALDTSVEELTSGHLTENLSPVGDLLRSNFLNELPLDLFGIELMKVIEIIAGAPTRVGAFISTLVELARKYALAEENFYFGALRAYLEMHNNYFPEIEEKVDDFRAAHLQVLQDREPVAALGKLLEGIFDYEIAEGGLDAYPELKELRAVYLAEQKRLLLNRDLSAMQKAFQYGKELGFQYLALTERAMTSSLLKVHTFEEVISHFKAGYFSAALLIPREPFLEDMRVFFGKTHFDPDLLLNLLQKYQASPEMLVQRMTNLLPAYLGIRKFSLLRVIHDLATDRFTIDKELHLGAKSYARGNRVFEHHCRRWSALATFDKLEQAERPTVLVGAQRSKFIGTEDEYVNLTLVRIGHPGADRNVSVTLAIQLDETVSEKIRFLDDPGIPVTTVGSTCERCDIADCTVRVAEPEILQARAKRKRMEKTLEQLKKGSA